MTRTMNGRGRIVIASGSSPYATAYTRTGKVDMTNRKPYRTEAQQAEAKRTARLVGGTYVSNAPVSYSKPKRRAA